jgi:acyl CoA:acetate/3-ketoacid CoA transferase beta subunit
VREPTLAEVCVVACAEAWRGDGAVLASAFGVIPTIGARLAKATFEPDLVVSDGEAYAVANPLRIGAPEKDKVVEAWIPFRSVFALVAAGRRHVMMGASQLDRFGNQNISCIGSHERPKVQLIGVRGAPGNTVNHATSYWVPVHSTRVFVERVDMVSGVGYGRLGGEAARYHDVRRVITNRAVFDFKTPSGTMRIRSLHPGVSVEHVVRETGFALEPSESIETTRRPTEDELALIRDVLDPDAERDAEVKP